MKNFKPGQKVVFKCNGQIPFAGSIIPLENEIVTLEFTIFSQWVLSEYKLSGDAIQIFPESVLFPLSEILAEETEKIIEKLTAPELQPHLEIYTQGNWIMP